jgi:Fe-S-cluster containining protein
MAKFLGMRSKEFLTEYTVETEDEGRILKRNENGCVFLTDNLCSVYEARPHTCEFFPHLVKGNGSFLSRMWQMADRAVYCPIVYNSLESFKDETSFKK